MLNFTTENEEREGYVDRVTVKAVILDAKGNMLTFGPVLVGGGVEEGESLEEALHREALEEVGVEIRIIKELGTTVAFRDFNKKRYVTHGFLCEFIQVISLPTTTDEVEKEIPAIWGPPEATLIRLGNEIDELQKQETTNVTSIKDIDYYESRIYNRLLAIHFIKLAT